MTERKLLEAIASEMPTIETKTSQTSVWSLISFWKTSQSLSMDSLFSNAESLLVKSTPQILVDALEDCKQKFIKGELSSMETRLYIDSIIERIKVSSLKDKKPQKITQ